ncbi:MAG: DNA polymerase III subunit chi [Deltaproteobacteria bacterium HGW-Deltaproteobacteria-4]|nr:MAG: DNA polymerase III subunit chi [Deltaproteobacteria bacterium HGW-Deltaproteobacteria-4]
MKERRAEFVRLRKSERARHLFELAVEFYNSGQRVLILVADDDQGVKLDHFLWTWKRDSFLPHAFDNGAVECLGDPIVIASTERNANASRVVILGRPAPLNFLRQFDTVIDFAETYDEELAAASRKRYRVYQEAGFVTTLRE